jgi:hypothetical protein
MAAERDLELLDDYLANRLDDQSKSAFEQKLQKDHGLKSEHELQQQFINGIKKARISELKALMNNVPVPAAQPGNSMATKVALWTVVAGIIGVGIYLYLKPEQTVTPAEETQVEQPASTLPDTEPEPEPIQPHEKSQEASEEPSDKPSSEHTPAPSPKTPVKSKTPEGAAVKERKPTVFDPTEDATENKPAAQDEPANNTAAKEDNNAPSIAVEIDNDNKKYTFHYQFKQGKLFLYGPFEKNLYEIMEFFADGDNRTVFLFYKGQYYLLKEDNEKLKPLKAIDDQALLKKLKEYRN